MSSTGLKRELSDSEGDEDYVPPPDGDGQDSESEESEPEGNKAEPTNVEPTVTEEERKRQVILPQVIGNVIIFSSYRAREALWSSFQESLAQSTTNPAYEHSTWSKMVKIERKYLFAGEEVSEVVEVPEDSPDAKKWPLFKDPESKSDSQTSASDVASASQPGPSLKPIHSESDATNPTPISKPPAKRPGPRKSKISLAPIPGATKPKKLTTLDKSAMDWKSHLQAEHVAGSSIADELAANRKGGGYLEKVEFLKRVEERKDETLESLKSNKRRRL